MYDSTENLRNKLHILNQIGVSLSVEKQTVAVLNQILTGAQKLTHADGGTIYLLKNNKLYFALIHNSSLNIHIEDTQQLDEKFKPIELTDDEGKANLTNVVSAAVNQNKTINIENAYNVTDYDFSGTKIFDQQLNYHSRSFLTVPMKNHLNEVIGVLQLINSMDPETKMIKSFNPMDQELVESLASQGAITLTKQELIDAQKQLFEAFIALIAKAIDEKSAYTSKHCTRVPLLAMMIAEEAQKSTKGALLNFNLSSDEMEELRISAWLHDCGKVSTPINIMDKSTKLQVITDGIELVNLRFEILRRDLIIKELKTILQENNITYFIHSDILQKINEINADWEFVQKVNIPGETLSKEEIHHIQMIKEKYSWENYNNEKQSLLNDLETENLSITRGSLNSQERQTIQNHAAITYKMLSSLPYPKHLSRIPEIASSHHEKLDGTGYPRGLNEKELLIQARIIAIADIFEALTAGDRPYKNAKKLSEVLHLMDEMQKNHHIDADLYQLFIEKKIYLRFAQEYLSPEQIDVD